ncbi:MAG: AAA family ATPase [Alphaproteobacteria bacterium]|nr:AAA family ATPase [Alphaproteobacteria bacterium]
MSDVAPSLASELRSHARRLPPARLRRVCDPKNLGFKTTAELKPFDGLIGQQRALEALDLGARIDKPGFNVFVLGERGTARHGTVRALIDQYAAKLPAPSDWVYVANFVQADRPRAISLPPGRAQEFKAAMDHAIDELQSLIPAIFESEEYQARRRTAIDRVNEAQEQAFEALNEKARAQQVALLRTPNGFTFAPLTAGGVMKPEDFNALPDAQRKLVSDKIESLQKDLVVLLERLPAWERERRQKVTELDREHARLSVVDIMQELARTFVDLPEVLSHIEAVTQELIRHAGLFRVSSIAKREEVAPGVALADVTSEMDPRLRRFRVNLLVGDGAKSAAPVVVEDNPSIANLVGRIEQQAQMGALFTDFTLIRAGCLHLANGGFLLIDARRLLLEPYAWEMLKRCLRARAVTIESPMDRVSIMSTQSLKPDPIPLSTKVILFGDRQLYHTLFEGDPDFAELFKIAVDFEDAVDWSDNAVKDYARLIGSIAQRESLRPLSANAVAHVIEELGREAEDASKLSLRIGALADRLREADFWAAEAGHKLIDAADFDRATAAYVRRHDRVSIRSQEMIERNIMLIDTSGAKIGQINGLSVMSLGGYAFGKPSRITARVRMGTGQVNDIEREVELGGPLHSKGVLILSSFLSSRYALDRPPSLSASLVFEQSYGGVDGDSASSTELYALLSALSETPIRQNFAVTGSVNQRGEVQAIGGVNDKIEGYFALCRARGLDGTHAVMIPKANEQHLMLRRDVVDAVEQGKFHIFSVATIDEGIELLTGETAGERAKDGLYPDGTINRRVEDKLIAFSESRRKFAQNSVAIA